MSSKEASIAEGEFRKLEGDLVPRSTDIVFIVEAKECHRHMKENRSFEQILLQLDKELKNDNFVDNRWSLVIFGGEGVYDKPKSSVLDSQIFTKNIDRFVDYIANIPIGKNGTEDVFEAIGFASSLVFRAGVSKTFILMPCSRCEAMNQSVSDLEKIAK